MLNGLIVKGRRYYSPRHGEYVVALVRMGRTFLFQMRDGRKVRLHPRSVRYLSDDDCLLCYDLADAARMTWFSPYVDEKTGTEVNVEYKRGRKVETSFRNAICDLSEGLIDMNFMDMEDPVECNYRFREILRGMKIDDPGDYLPSLPQYFMNGKSMR